ncbi:MAG: hypothetical protein KAV82_02375 [Phycisphaerae bacterium]|nr:hypothetical protein [Phycisphaerae bacterium]
MSPDEAQTADSSAGSFKKKLITLVIVLGVMLIEGAAIFVVVRMTGESPEDLQAAELENREDLLKNMDAELPLGECDAINRKSGRSIVVHLVLYARVAADKQKNTLQLIEKRQSTIKDRVQMILRRADPQHLHEPNLDTIKRQIKFELDKILEDDELILEVLIPQILQTSERL